MKKILLIVGVCALVAVDAKALTIIPVYDGFGTSETPPTNTVGGGSWTNIIQAVCDRYSQIIRDPGTITIHFYWSSIIPAGAEEVLLAQGGTPNRCTEAEVIFNSEPGYCYYFDPTPLQDAKFTGYTEISDDLGGGTVNISRFYQTGVNAEDLYSLAEHEIGHALGMDPANYGFQAEDSDGALTIHAPLPYAGTTIGLQTTPTGQFNGDSAYVSNTVVNITSGAIPYGTRCLPSVLDILLWAEVSKYTNFDLTLGVPDVSIAKSRSGMTIAWTPMIGNYALQHDSDLRQTSAWTTNGLPSAVNNNGVYTVTVSKKSLQPMDFFRLERIN